jgi:putative membrane protein
MDAIDNRKLNWRIFFIFIFSMASVVITSCGFMYGPYGRRHGPGVVDGWYGGLFEILFTIIIWGLAIVGLISILKGIFSKGRISDNTETQESNAMEILKERYARGEIDKNEFDTKKKDIG